jgi:Na+(H+)/acetate symporter ActP
MCSFGGMRGTVWVNIFQTVLFPALWAPWAVAVISHYALPGGFGDYIRKIASSPKTSYLLTRSGCRSAIFGATR